LYDDVIRATFVGVLAKVCGPKVRVNARLDDERAEKLKQLQSLTGQSASDVLKRALDLMYARQVASARKKLDALLSSDFIGCADGPEDLANQYKDYLTRDLNAKHGAR